MNRKLGTVEATGAEIRGARGQGPGGHWYKLLDCMPAVENFSMDLEHIFHLIAMITF